MAQWKASVAKQPSMTKAELRLMLTEAVRNTEPGADQKPKRSPKVESEQS